jgi:type IV secretory pathway VirB10-like protein
VSDYLSDDPMSPAASPGALSKRTGVRRVNNLPVYLVGGVLVAFLGIMVMVAVDRATQHNKPAEMPIGKGDTSSMVASEIAGKQKDGIIPAETEPILIARPENLDAPPKPPSSAGGGQLQTSGDDELTRIRMAKLQQFEEAVKAKTTVEANTPRSSSSPLSGAPARREDALAQIAAARRQIDAVSADDPTAAYKARLAQLQSSDLSGGVGSPADGSALPQLPQAAAANSKNSVSQFAGSNQGDRWKLQSQPEAPRTAFELRAGFVVPATLISGINSDLPGQIVAQVAQNVYDTPTGKHLLLPQGSRLVGSYSSDVGYGQARILVAWQRIVFPDGKAMDIGAMPGADGAGQAGFSDEANNHYFRLFGSALLMSAVTAGISYSQRQNDNSSRNAPTTSSALSEALGQQLGQVTAQLIAKNLNISPTLEIRPGYRFNVIVVKDLTFSKPYKSFDY